MNKKQIIEEYELDRQGEEMKKYYEEEYEKIQSVIKEYSERIFFNKICVLDSEEFFMDIRSQFEEDIDEDEDFLNARIHYTYKTETLSNKRELTVYSQRYDSKYFNEVQCCFAKSVSEFIDAILKIENKPNHKCVYRGHGNWKYDLVPGIYREQNKHLLQNESKILREFIASNPKFFEGCQSALDYLAVLQHHRLPTRLLDFTENPLVALYMACDSDVKEHGDVIRIDIKEDYYKYYDSDTVSILSNLAFFDDDIDVSDFDYYGFGGLFEFSNSYAYNRYGKCKDEAKCEQMIKDFNSRKDIQRLVHRIRSEKPYFDNKIDPQHLDNMIVMVKPRQSFERLNLQSGLFAIFGINEKKSEKVDFESQNLEYKITHIIIPDECKSEILKELDKLQINRGTLYGDMDSIVADYLQKSK